MFIFEQHLMGGDRNFGYLIGDRDAGVAAVVDPSYSPETLLERAAAQNLTIKWILNTHSHGDHTNGNSAVKKQTGAELVAHTSAHPDIGLNDGDSFAIGSIQLTVLHVPGHCDDHVVYYIPDYEVCITGDLLFVGKVGGTATEASSRTEWDSLHKVLSTVSPNATVWPGHNYGCRPSSTIALEKATNPFLLCETIGAFLDLKQKWPSFKQEKGLL